MSEVTNFLVAAYADADEFSLNSKRTQFSDESPPYVILATAHHEACAFLHPGGP